MIRKCLQVSLCVLAFLSPCSLRAGLTCETWLTLGTAVRYDDVKIKERRHGIIPILETEGNGIFPNGGDNGILPNFLTEKYSDSRAIVLVTASGHTHADHAYFKVYADWGEVQNRSVNDLWLAVGYWQDLFFCRFHVIPNFGVTTSKQRAMDIDSIFAGMDLRFDMTRNTTVWTELGYHFARFRERQKHVIKFDRKKGHGLVAKFGLDTTGILGWYGGVTFDIQDWQSTDSKNLEWCLVTAGAHFGYQF